MSAEKTFALGLDYLLTVAVGISAGVGAITSAMPDLLPHTLALALAVRARRGIVAADALYVAAVMHGQRGSHGCA